MITFCVKVECLVPVRCLLFKVQTLQKGSPPECKATPEHAVTYRIKSLYLYNRNSGECMGPGGHVQNGTGASSMFARSWEGSNQRDLHPLQTLKFGGDIVMLFNLKI